MTVKATIELWNRGTTEQQFLEQEWTDNPTISRALLRVHDLVTLHVEERKSDPRDWKLVAINLEQSA